MSGYVLTPLATADVFHIWIYISRHNQNAADRVEQAIFEACAALAEAPMRGRRRPELTARPLRF
jgi:plasmid stabilization system protein ParE